jgi:hypothetical protein
MEHETLTNHRNKSVTTTLPPPVLEAVERKAIQEDRTVSHMLRILIQRGLAVSQQEQRQQAA